MYRYKYILKPAYIVRWFFWGGGYRYHVIVCNGSDSLVFLLEG